MARIICSVCKRAKKACICQFICNIDNAIQVIILQHPLEINQSKGTATLLANSLTNVTILKGEDFSNNEQFNQILKVYGQSCYLLYPDEHSFELSNNAIDNENGLLTEPKCLVLLDGTWKKAFRMYMLSNNLHKLAKLSLPISTKGQYIIRKTKKPNALSTLEATCHALALLENDVIKYQPLIDSFIAFNQFQLSFNPNNQ